MAWEHAKQIFPSNEAPLPDGSYISVEELQASDIKTLFKEEYIYNRDALIGINKYVWGNNGEYAYINTFDLFNIYEHPNEIRPLNSYGTIMVNDYITYNNIDTNIGVKTLFY